VDNWWQSWQAYEMGVRDMSKTIEAVKVGERWYVSIIDARVVVGKTASM